MRGKGNGIRSGEVYSITDYNFILQHCKVGTPIYRIAQLLGRGESDDIRRASDRLCWNSSAYPNKKLYANLKPLTDKILTLNGFTKKYIRVQWSEIDRKDRPTVRELSRRLGIPVKIIQGFIIKNNSWKKKPKPKLFDRGE